MKKQITYTMTALLATIAISIAAPPDKAAMEGKEKAAWQAFKDKNRTTSKRSSTRDSRGVYADGMSDSLPEGIGRHAKVGHEIVCDQRLRHVLR